MVFQPCPGVAVAEQLFTQQEQVMENVYHVLSTATWDAAALGGLADVIEMWENSTAAPLRANSVACTGIRLRDLTTENGAETLHSIIPPITGGADGNPEPQNVTVAVKGSTGTAGRSNRGRSYWVGMTKAHTDTGMVGVGWSANILAAMNALLAAINGGGPWKLGVLSRRHNGAARAHGILTPFVTYELADLFVDSQRRRLPGHNRHR